VKTRYSLYIYIYIYERKYINYMNDLGDWGRRI
jgi:hypothetical protein